MTAWEAVQRGEENPLADVLAADPEITRFLPGDDVRRIIAQGAGVGDAPERSRELARAIRAGLH